MDYEVRQAMIERARRDRAEAIWALVAAAASALRMQWRRLHRAWTGVRIPIAPRRSSKPETR